MTDVVNRQLGEVIAVRARQPIYKSVLSVKMKGI